MLAIKLVAAVTALALMTAPVAAQDWPTRPVTMVVPTTPGGAPDLLGRVVASRLSELLGQPVIVENVAGAGGMIGAARVARAPADGYQFLIGTLGTQAQNQTLYKSPLYNSARDFTPVALLWQVRFILIARKDLPAANLRVSSPMRKPIRRRCITARQESDRPIIWPVPYSMRRPASASPTFRIAGSAP